MAILLQKNERVNIYEGSIKTKWDKLQKQYTIVGLLLTAERPPPPPKKKKKKKKLVSKQNGTSYKKIYNCWITSHSWKTPPQKKTQTQYANTPPPPSPPPPPPPKRNANDLLQSKDNHKHFQIISICLDDCSSIHIHRQCSMAMSCCWDSQTVGMRSLLHQICGVQNLWTDVKLRSKVLPTLSSRLGLEDTASGTPSEKNSCVHMK